MDTPRSAALPATTPVPATGAPGLASPLAGPPQDERIEAPQVGDPFGQPVAVQYSFAFIDISGFTSYCEAEGEHAAIELLSRFRFLTRSVVVRRGVRIAKWLGDGVMLVAVNQNPAVATAAELMLRCAASGIETHVGLVRGPVLLFEGDDYVGRPVNLAARLCDVAGPCQMLASGLVEPLPTWVTVEPIDEVVLPGIGTTSGIVALEVVDEVARRFGLDVAAA
jgi:class 3 adenylate cyclase